MMDTFAVYYYIMQPCLYVIMNREIVFNWRDTLIPSTTAYHA